MTTRTNPRQSARSILVGVLCMPFFVSACGATSYPPAPTVTRWPAPAPQTPVQWPTQAAQSQTRPNFEAPSARHCARPAQTVEVPGRPVAQWPERAVAGGSYALREDGARLAESMPSDAAAARAPSASPSAPTPSAAEATRAPAVSELSKEAPAADYSPQPAPVSPPVQRQRLPRHEAVTAGMVDDNADFSSYLQFRQRNAGVAHRERDVSERHLLQVRTSTGEVVSDAEVAVHAANGSAMWARTDAGGRVWLHPRAFDGGDSTIYEVVARKNGRQSTGFLRRGQKSATEIILDAGPAPQRARLDLLFMVDATGSMGDEIAKLRATLHTIAREVAALPSRPDTCFGLVAYRDQGDAFLLRRHDLTNDLSGFQRVLDGLQAAGGGDYPEAMNEALHDAVHRISWRGDGATRLVVLLADAPPHLDYGGPQYDDDMLAALGKGIKVFSVGASGLDTQGE